MITTRRVVLAATLLSGAALASAAGAQTGPQIGAPAPAFTSVDVDGRKVSLSDYKGKTVVLEWTNDGCPFVKKHYDGRNMQALQSKWTGRDVVWLTVISSPLGEQGYADGPKAKALTAASGARPTAVLLDPAGDVGRAYRAQVTPHMYVVRGDGTLAYMGGIDDKPSTRLEDLQGARNYVDAALSDLAEGRPVSTPTARAYGCTVKFTS